ncbi:GNAT family N-acetyltransferase [Rossellomorea marisflavi]|uniref:GNAT family N-acetyltransferase n=1 Tax=Rossellomorea marisflavi TaxID=189381 RepID=UPI0007006CDC|nr:GNAT family N-acetyltransferase [Rossellomorea marisflavi]KQU63860.1 GCN5 family acetyltransferase [Bacillus sp. Leaf406]MDW4525290.1 GNAT family N-acetyltransferase [Rossellomorea marisflavi]WJV21225.1 GNAT family N-acetyltransferase [Rossellomorea marisflavi]
MKTYKLEQRTPTLQEYIRLCDSVGWTDFMNYDAAERSLENSLFSVVITDHEKAIGMGRIIGDGAIYFYIQDIVVHPDHQGKGLGQEIMGSLVGYLKDNAPDKAFVGLFASGGKESFYEKYEFKDHSPNMTGMFTVVLKDGWGD